MTRASQKDDERRVLEDYFKITRTPFQIVEERERPDFVVEVGGLRIGVEITGYHVPNRLPGGFTRREVEDAWEALRLYVVEFRKTHRELEGLSVYLDFKAFRVPPPREFHDFVDAVRALIAGQRPLSDGYHYLEITAKAPPVVHRYLKAIRLRRVKCYMEWDWNRSAGCIGTSDQEMLDVLRPKLVNYQQPGNVKASHLILAGWSGRMSEIIAPLSAEQFSGFTRLNDALEQGPFDQVAVLCLRNLIWERGRGWRMMPPLDGEPSVLQAKIG